MTLKIGKLDATPARTARTARRRGKDLIKLGLNVRPMFDFKMRWQLNDARSTFSTTSGIVLDHWRWVRPEPLTSGKIYAAEKQKLEVPQLF